MQFHKPKSLTGALNFDACCAGPACLTCHVGFAISLARVVVHFAVVTLSQVVGSTEVAKYCGFILIQGGLLCHGGTYPKSKVVNSPMSQGSKTNDDSSSSGDSFA